MDGYEIVPDGERKLMVRSEGSVRDGAKRREAKIKKFRLEREIKKGVEVSCHSFHPADRRERDWIC